MKGLDYMYRWFKDYKTVEDLKETYKKLCRQYHPDFNERNTTETMQAINNEYETAFERLKNVHRSADNDGDTYTAKTETTETAAEFMEIINKLIVCGGLEIELIGRWIWLSGNTYPYKDIIKSLGFKWCSTKKLWAWHKAEDASHNRKKMSIEEIKDRYGCETFKGVGTPRLVTA